MPSHSRRNDFRRNCSAALLLSVVLIARVTAAQLPTTAAFASTVECPQTSLCSSSPSGVSSDSSISAESQQEPASDGTQQELPPTPTADPVTVFPQHLIHDRFWISGQANIIEQWHGDFRALYSGPNSLRNTAEHGASRLFTLYTVAKLSSRSEVIFNLEDASGFGISNSLGLAGFTNIDVVRIPGEGSPLSTAPYVARALFHYVVPLTGDREEAEASQLGILTSLPTKRIEFRIGTFSLADYFDGNAIGSDSHLQFMNWAIVNNGAWDYAADTRGYTWAAILELHERAWSLRFGEALMPKIANGIDFEWNLRTARAHNLELELRPPILPNRHSTVRLLAYRNIANMGNYRDAIRAFQAGETATPDVVAVRQNGRTKNGVGLNLEQELPAHFRAFLRFGYNDGHNESFAYTEVDRTICFGADLAGDGWRRPHDRFGAAFVSNGLSADHRQYLALGGQGFLLGDGRLNYGREKIVEMYYTAHLWRGVFGAFDLQHINNPGYNRDRGPATVPALRLHVDF